MLRDLHPKYSLRAFAPVLWPEQWICRFFALIAILTQTTLFAVDVRLSLPLRKLPNPGYYNFFDRDLKKNKILDWQCGSKTYDGHPGIDFRATSYSDVLAAAPGEVLSAEDGLDDGGWPSCGQNCGTGNYGNQVRIKHLKDGSVTIYGHLQKGTITVIKGDHVVCGQKIGESGNSGLSSDPHLHFEFRSALTGERRPDGLGLVTAIDPFGDECGTLQPSYWIEQNWDSPSRTCEVWAFEGYLDSADCNVITGWAWDPDRPNNRLQVRIYDENNTLLGEVVADRFRVDLLVERKGDGWHGFTFPTPATLRDGAWHTVHVKAAFGDAEQRPSVLRVRMYLQILSFPLG